MLVAALASGALDGFLPRTEALCQVGGTVSECGVATGVVLSVDGPSLATVDGFSLRTPAGEVLEFRVERLEVTGGGKPAPHLREHRLDGQPITVEYKLDAGHLVALRYTDAE
ncbi:hypothetical protein BH24CHL6_BH24CHL6_10760 [soil metagenome]